MTELSSTLLLVAFIIYVAATIIFGIAVTGKKFKSGHEEEHKQKWGKIGYIVTIAGFLAQLGYFITRWIAGGHAPLSNLFEYTTFYSMMLVLGFIVIFQIYKNNFLGIVALPVAIVVIAYASVFPRDIAPLIPALQSYWLQIHVSMAALGEGILSISFIAGLIYLIKVVDQSKRSKETLWLEIVLFSIITTVGFVVVAFTFQFMDYKASFTWVNERGVEAQLDYDMPAIAGPYGGTLITKDKFGPLFEAPSWFNGSAAPRKFNTLIWSVLAGLVIYGLLRLILRKRIGAALQPLVKSANIKLLDEIGYRSVAIGFPIFTLGGLIFAAIWAQIAWTRFWGWDPKEVWAFITFLFYAAYLHLRLSKGWEGKKSAWLAVGGFAIIMFNLVAVNLVLAGLHSYA